MALEVKNQGIVSRARPVPPNVDGALIDQRFGRFGDIYALGVMPTDHVAADEGSYWVATNPTPSTGVAYGSGGTQATFADAAAAFVWKNNASAADGIRMYLKYVRMILGGTIPASSTSLQFAVKVDNGNRVPTANATAITPVNPNMDIGAGSGAPAGVVYVPNGGIPTVPAAVSARLIGRGSLRQVIPVVLDELELRFGAVDGPGAVVATGAGRYVTSAPPVVIGPQQFALLHLWLPSGTTSPLTFEFETAWVER